MKRLLSLLILLSMLLSTLSCADFLSQMTPAPPVDTPVAEPSEPETPEPPSEPETPETPVIPAPPPIVMPETETETPEAVAASYRLVTEGAEYTLFAVYRSADNKYWSITREGAYTVKNGVYTLSHDGEDDLYGAYFDGVFYLTDEHATTLPSPLRGGDGVTVVTLK